ncbi:MAG TPA: hypothetical protein DDY31_03950 [Lachnospiraceae bacterium]|nr:hypothetical protein [Lachnospiraceae bacterium]
MGKIWLVEGYCPKDRYQCLMPVSYEPVGEGGIAKEYRKEKMACRHVLEGDCDMAKECAFFEEAPETLEKNTQWYEA